MINFKLELPGSNYRIFEIRFNQNKKVSELIDWIYDNYNEFFNLKDKNTLNLYNKNNGQNSSHQDKQLSLFLRQNDLLLISEIENQKNLIPPQPKQLKLFLKGFNEILEYEIASDATIQELTESLLDFLQDAQKISNHTQVQLFYEQKNLSNNKFLTLSDLKIRDQDVIYFNCTFPPEIGQITILILCNGACHRFVFNRSDTLITVLNKAQKQFGYNENIVAFDLYIKGEYYSSEEKRKQTLAQIQLQDQDTIEIKLRFMGGR